MGYVFREVTYLDGTKHMWYMCPGCGYEHAFSPNVHRWNGDYQRPSIQPSLLQSNPQGHHTCHSYITDGRIQFLGDCWHDKKNMTVDLVPYDPAKHPQFVDMRNTDDDSEG